MTKMPATPRAPAAPLSIRGVRLWKGFLDRPAQEALRDAVRDVATAAPLFSPETRWGKKMSVRMTSAGRFGWYSDRRGYRYVDKHPSGTEWPPIPPEALAVWDAVAGVDRQPECCLVNFYTGTAKMGLHQDRDEADFDMPVVSVSLGDDALFRVGTEERGGTTESVWLASGDVLVLGGEARLLHHGVDRVKPGTSTLLKDGGRINLTMRVVT